MPIGRLQSQKPALFALLGATEKTGITLTESCAMHPASSGSGLYFNHPDSNGARKRGDGEPNGRVLKGWLFRVPVLGREQPQYFAVGKLGKDKIADYAARKGIAVTEAEKWLAPYLDY